MENTLVRESQVVSGFELYIEAHHIISNRRMNTSAEGIISIFVKTMIPPGIIQCFEAKNTFSIVGIRNINCTATKNFYFEFC